MTDTDNPITHVFDQTNGVIDGLEGESDGTAAGDLESAADRGRDDAVPVSTRQDADPVDGRLDAGDDAGSAAPERPQGTVVQQSEASPAEDVRAAPVDAGDEGEHTYAVDSAGAATDTTDASEGGTAEAYDAGPAAEVAGAPDDGADRHGGRTAAVAADEHVASSTARSYDDGPTAEAGSGAADTGDRSFDQDPAAGATGRPNGLAALIGDGDDSIGHTFDQTNGLAEGLEGESGGTAEGDEDSAGDRRGLNEPNPVGQQDAFHDDHYGAEDGRDPNP